METTMPMNKAKLVNGTALPDNRGYKYKASSAPDTKGTRMLACEVAITVCARFLIKSPRRSNPTMNMYRITPNCEMTPRKGATDGGRINAEMDGPSSDGPSTIPASTSPITGGCPTYVHNFPRIRPVTITARSAMRTWKSSCGCATKLCAGDFSALTVEADRLCPCLQIRYKAPIAERIMHYT